MNLTTSLAGRIRNTSLSRSRPLLPLLEAVVNGLQTIDARFESDMSLGELTIRVQRLPQDVLDAEQAGQGRSQLEPIIGFTVEDNGEGFTPANLQSFQTLDGDYKAALGGRGMGRLLWLKAFERVEIDSAYNNDQGVLEKRKLHFTIRNGVTPGAPTDLTAESPGSVVKLIGFKDEYRRNAPKSADPIAREVFEHCLWYFLRPGGAPNVRLVDEDTISLNAMLDAYGAGDIVTSHMAVKGVSFDMVSLRARSAMSSVPRSYWCAASRVVTDENLTGKVPGLHGRLHDGDSEFTYASFLSSDYLDRHVRADRTDFDIPDYPSASLDREELTIEDIRQAVYREVGQVLAESLSKARSDGQQRVTAFVSTKAPRYRPLLPRIQESGMTIDPAVGDRDLELQLHRYLRDLEVETLAEGQAVLSDVGAGMDNDQRERLQNYLAKVEDLKKSDLAAYVFKRRVVLDILAQLIQSGADGKYPREEAVHQLLMPMGKDSNELEPEVSNLWLIDERLAFHDYLASDKTLRSMPVTGSDSTKEPDILATRLIDTPVLVAERTNPPLASITVFEIKRPMRNDGTSDNKNPINQASRYVELVRAGGVKTANGRPIPKSEHVPGFVYIIADLTPSMIEHCKSADLRATHDGMGYFGYNSARDCFIEVISFDKLVNAARERNRAFFDKLGLPTT